MQKRAWPVLVVSFLALDLALAGCADPEPPPELEAELAQLQDERDTLAEELEEAHREIGALRDEVARIELPEAFLTQLESEPRTAADSVRAVALRAERSAGALQDAATRASLLQQRVDSLESDHETAVTAYEEQLADESERRQAVETEARQLSTENEDLQEEVDRLSRFVQELESELGTAYYVVGTREELLERGVVTEEGGARFLGFLWKRGETLVPARGPDPDQFTRIDLSQDLEIPLPRADATYRIVSRHDPRHLGAEASDSGTLQSERLEILDPEAFWQTSSFLILIEEGS